MIRVNLLRNMGSTAQAGGPVTIDFTESSAPKGALEKQASLRIVAMMVPLAALYWYQTDNLSKLDVEVAAAAAEVQKVDAEITKFGLNVPKVDEFNAKKVVLEKELDVLAKLGKSRLVDVKMLDTLQNLVTPNIWFKSINIKDLKVSIEGSAFSFDAATAFVRSLEDTPYFSEFSDPSITTDSPTSQMQKFKISFTIGKK